MEKKLLEKIYLKGQIDTDTYNQLAKQLRVLEKLKDIFTYSGAEIVGNEIKFSEPLYIDGTENDVKEWVEK